LFLTRLNWLRNGTNKSGGGGGSGVLITLGSEEELLVLESIFGSDFEPRNFTSLVVKLHLDELAPASSAQLEIYFPPGMFMFFYIFFFFFYGCLIYEFTSGCQYPFNNDPPVTLFFDKSLLACTNYGNFEQNPKFASPTFILFFFCRNLREAQCPG
jgi:hypothetical protein